MKADWKRILAYFRSHEGIEVDAYVELVGPDGLRVLEYTGRINNARRKISCHCAKTDPILCLSREHILNTRKGFYVYYTGPRRGVQSPGKTFTPAPLPELPERVAKLEGEHLSRWNEIGDWLKTKKQMPVIFEKQVLESLI